MIETRVAGPDDLTYIVSLQDANWAALGFMTRVGLDNYLNQRRVSGRCGIVMENAEPAGYVLGDVSRGVLRIQQACIQYDARKRHTGTALVQWALQTWQPHEVRLKCAADLDSNEFWKSLGFVCVGVETDQERARWRRTRPINVWRLQLAPVLFGLDPVDHVRTEGHTGLWYPPDR